jgi:hypothetical protein
MPSHTLNATGCEDCSHMPLRTLPSTPKRLAGIDPATLELADLPELRVMTKADMMDRLDDVFTDRRLDRATVRCAIGATAAEPDRHPHTGKRRPFVAA